MSAPAHGLRLGSASVWRGEAVTSWRMRGKHVSFTDRAESLRIGGKQYIGANFVGFYSVVTVSNLKWTF